MISSMFRTHPIRQFLTREHALPLLAYAALVVGLAAVAWLAIASLAEDYASYRSAADLLQRIEGHKTNTADFSSDMSGSPLLEGPTIEVAGAELQQRLVSAVKAVDGNVLSSQVDLQGSESKPGYITLTASCEIGETALQELLYDLESGMPFLFIDQLVVQKPQAARGIGGENEAARMRVQIEISGRWQVTK